MSKIASGQASASAAEIYEEFYLPALFLEWGRPAWRRRRAWARASACSTWRAAPESLREPSPRGWGPAVP